MQKRRFNRKLSIKKAGLELTSFGGPCFTSFFLARLFVVLTSLENLEDTLALHLLLETLECPFERLIVVDLNF